MIFCMKNMFQDVQKDVHLFINMFVELMEGEISVPKSFDQGT